MGYDLRLVLTSHNDRHGEDLRYFHEVVVLVQIHNPGENLRKACDAGEVDSRRYFYMPDNGNREVHKDPCGEWLRAPLVPALLRAIEADREAGWEGDLRRQRLLPPLLRAAEREVKFLRVFAYGC